MPHKNKDKDRNRTAGKPVRGEPAVPVDCQVEIRIEEDYSKAYIVVFPPRGGGRDVTRGMIDDILETHGIVYNLNNRAINEMVEKKKYRSEFVAASALMPVEGTDGDVKYTFEQNNDLVPKEMLNDFVDYKELGFIRSVSKGDIIAEITYPVEGTDGIDIRGNPMKAKPVKKPDYKIGANTLVTEDGTKLYAACDGNVKYIGGAFTVDPALTINGDVDASTGNIDFIGDVIVKGEVTEGFSVYSERNIVIMGNVNNATVKAGGMLVMKGSINSNVTAASNLTCQFCEHSRIYSGGNMTASSFLDCEVYCGGNMNCMGAMNGGLYTVIGSAETVSIGSRSYVYTEFTSGNDAILVKERTELEKKIASLEDRISECSKTIDFINEKRHTEGHLSDSQEVTLGEMIKKRLACQIEKKHVETQVDAVNNSLAGIKNIINCKGKIYPNTTIYMSESSKTFKDEISAVRICLDENNNVVAESLY